ncbi:MULTISPECIES: sensor domain-containing diguanylate cyclase [unclassified Variovorax]|uniref:sensor domain-containing diguanylate cyclase n=1 Tax=unclassified Variovorax TaxID=663243 RepID=UPI000F7EC28B|nr:MULTISPECIES: sensor domain-containing diguanylate cyclase [unclassified Variovorax]RSZ31482.1 GGDEF domain-containing protein [Variovorax sp. 553]RSZ31768.1 GGDEF domain-containing protein [Variovorax sp. 679]
MEFLIEQLSDSVSSAKTLEDLARPMLEMLEAATGLESAYLAVVEPDKGRQHILFAHNAGDGLAIPEGAYVPWTDTLCRHALEEDRIYTDDAGGCWGDAQAAHQLGIQTCASAPVKTDDGEIYGALCAASARQTPLPPIAEPVLRLFARLIGQQVERELTAAKLRKASADLATNAATDALTGLPNRRALVDALQRMLAQGARSGQSVLVGFVDMDDFKKINDAHGHEVGDEFLSAMAKQLANSVRASDMLARFGSDEFVVIGLGPALGESPRTGARALADRLAENTIGELQLKHMTIDYTGASVGVVAVDPRTTSAEEALRQADVAMYAVKHSRRNMIHDAGATLSD